MFSLSRFEFGACAPLHIRHERIALGLSAPVKLLYASDLHLGWRWTNPLIGQLLNAASSVAPDAIILGGDLADRRRALAPFRDCVASLVAIAPVYAMAGNHDHRLGAGQVQSAAQSGGAVWLTGDHKADPIKLRPDLHL